MHCDDARFFLRLRRPGSTNSGRTCRPTSTSTWPGARPVRPVAATAGGFDRTVGLAVRAVVVPAGARARAKSRLMARPVGRRPPAGVPHHRHGRGRAADVRPGFRGVFGHPPAARHLRPGDGRRRPDRDAGRGHPGVADGPGVARRHPGGFDYGLLVATGVEKVQGRDVPVVTFRHPAGAGLRQGVCGPHGSRPRLECRDGRPGVARPGRRGAGAVGRQRGVCVCVHRRQPATVPEGLPGHVGVTSRFISTHPKRRAGGVSPGFCSRNRPARRVTV